MERLGFIVLTLVSLVTASPHGYGAKSAAVARAEASAGAGAFGVLPVIPADLSNSPGFSGSYSKSSSSSYASSSASSSSSSSSFSFSGTGSNVIPCLSGSCHGKNKFDSNVQGVNGNGIQGHGTNNAAAGANAISGIQVPNSNNGLNGPCVGTNCNNNGLSNSNGCSSGKCGSAENTPGKCTSSSCGQGTLGGSNANSQSEINNSENYNNVNVASKPQQPIESQTKPFQNGQPSTGNQPQFTPASGTDLNNDKVKSSECDSPDCDLFVPLSPEKKGYRPVNKPSTHLETPYEEKACTTHDCVGSSNVNSEPGKLPSSYNVPILGINNENNYKPSPNCVNGNCRPAGGDNKNYIQQHADQNSREPIESDCPSGNCASLPTGSNVNVNSCTSNNCASPSYSTKGGNNGLNCISGICKNPSLESHSPQIPSFNPSLQPSISSNSDVPQQHIPSNYQPNAPNGPDTNSFLQPSTPTGPKFNQPLKPNASTGPDTISSIQPHIPPRPKSNEPLHPSAPSDSDVNSPYNPYSPYTSGSNIDHQTNIPNKPHATPVANPSYRPYEQTAPNSPYKPNFLHKSDVGSDCLTGDCNKNVVLSPQNIQISNGQNPAAPSYNSFIKPSNEHQNVSPPQIKGNQPDCASPSCSSPTDFGPSYVTSVPKTSGTVNSKPYDSTYISTFDNPSKLPNSDSTVLLYNKGNQIYSGGFGGPVGLLSTNKKHSDSQITVNPSQQGTNSYNNPYVTNDQSKPYLQNGYKPSTTDLSLPTISGGTRNHFQQASADGHSNSKPTYSVGSGSPNGQPTSNIPNGATPINKEQPYTGGFGGPAGLLKPNEHALTPNGQKPACVSGDCGANFNNQGSTSSNGAFAVANAEAVAYSGGFGGPPGLLKPYDSGKIEGTGQQNLRDNNGRNLGAPGVNNHNLQPHGALSGAQANAVASASSTATGDVGHSGGCNNGCTKGKDGFNHGYNVSNASASAKSVAGAASYAQAGSVASASAHASAGASVKGGYAWR